MISIYKCRSMPAALNNSGELASTMLALQGTLGSGFAKALFVLAATEAEADPAIVSPRQRVPQHTGVFADQQGPLGIAGRMTACRQQVLPGRAAAVHQRLPAARGGGPGAQGAGTRAHGGKIDKVVRVPEALQPALRLAAGIAGGESVQDQRHALRARTVRRMSSR